MFILVVRLQTPLASLIITSLSEENVTFCKFEATGHMGVNLMNSDDPFDLKETESTCRAIM